jgi:ABC-type transporter Mla subunit MlaD
VQTYYTPQTKDTSAETGNALGELASEFSKNIEEASGKLIAAAGQFSAVSDGFNTAVAEVKAAAARAEEAREAAEAIQTKMDRDYGNFSELMRDLQERIGALAVLAKPLAAATQPAPTAPNEGPAPAKTVEPATAPEITDIRARWQGWQG